MKRKLCATVAAAVALPLIAGTPAAMADVFVVDAGRDTADPRPNNGVCQTTTNNRSRCSLRAAIQTAEASPGRDGINVRVDTIRLRVGAAGDGNTASGDLDITTEIRIVDRDEPGTLVDARSIDRIFDVAASGDLTVKNLTLSQGAPPATESGGAIRNAGNLDVRKAVISDNAATGAGGSGGAIVSSGELSVANSELSDNSAERAGGAIELEGPAAPVLNEVNNTEISGNTAGVTPGNGGGLHITGSADVVITDSLISGNTATLEGGGLWNSVGTMRVLDSTISDNVADGPAQDDGGGGLFNNGGTLIVGDGVLVDANEATGTSGSGGGILNNGGSLDVSGATISGNDAQRAGGGIESNGTGLLNIANAVLDGNNAGANPGNGGGLHITGMGDADISGGAVTDNVASREGGGLWNDQGTTIVSGTDINGNTANGGVASDDGGGGLFNNGGDVVVNEGTQVTDNSAAGTTMGSGGGILNVGGDLDVTGATISGNHAQRAGGGIETTNGTVDLMETRLLGNSTGPSPGNGGGLHGSETNTVNVTDSLVRDNAAAAEGGGLWNNMGTMTVEGTVVRGNSAAGPLPANGGGGLFQNPGGTTVVQDGSAVVSNEATGTSGSGGGILNDQGTLTVIDSIVTKNDAVRAGGGIEANIGTTTLEAVTLSKNNTGANPGNGGGLHLSGAGAVDIDDSAVVQNSASNEGGGLWNSATGTMDVDTTAICNNTAPTGANVFQMGMGTGFTVNDAPAVDGTPCAVTTGPSGP